MATAEELYLDKHRRRAFRIWRWRSKPRRMASEVRRIGLAANRAAALFLTILGFLLTLVGLLTALVAMLQQADWVQPGDRPVITMLVLLAAIVGSYLVTGLLVPRRLPPEDLAPLYIQGRSTREILESIALQIHRVATTFVEKTARYSDTPANLLCPRITGVDSSTQIHLKEAKKAIGRVRKLSKKEDMLFRRIEALKYEAARELGLTARCLCDHVFQFSPTMFRVGLDKYLRNLNEMLELASEPTCEDADIERFRGLIRQNKRLEQDCRDRARIQELLLRFDDLHADICALSSTRSTSASLQAYSRALSKLAKQQHLRLRRRSWHRGWRRWTGKVEDPDYVEASDRFRFLYRRQQAHPGFDLHTLLSQLVDGLQGDEFDAELVEHQRDALGDIERHGFVACLQPEGEQEGHHRQMVIARLQAIAQLHRYFNRAVSLARTAMGERFRRLLKTWCDGVEDGEVFLVTGGYSKTVRDVICHALGPAWDRQEEDEETDEESGPRPSLFQLLAGDEAELDTRLLTWELRAVRDRSQGRPMVGSGEMFLSLIRPGNRVLILLGAEAVDSEFRVIHPRSMFYTLRPVIEGLRQKEIERLVVVAAESFKCLSHPFSRVSGCRGLTGRVAIYEKELVHWVLSNRETDRSVEQVVRERLDSGDGSGPPLAA